MVTDKEIESALDNKYDGVDSFLLVQEILELEVANAALEAEKHSLKEIAKENTRLKAENKHLRADVGFYHRQVDGFVEAQ